MCPVCPRDADGMVNSVDADKTVYTACPLTCVSENLGAYSILITDL